MLWDMLPDGKKVGGATANFAYHVSQFGLNGIAVSAIGRDSLGAEIEAELASRGLKTILEKVEYPTGTVQVSLDDSGIPAYDIRQNVAWDNIALKPEILALASKTQAVSFGSLAQRNVVSRETIRAFVDAVPDDALKVFDINLRQNFYTKETIAESLNRCNVLKINDEELVVLSRLFGFPGIDLDNKCWILLGRYNLRMLILTCGINGSYVFSPGACSFVETPAVQVADTVGAGDSFSAAFTAAILGGKDIPAAHRLAVETSAYVCTQAGAMPVLPPALTDKIK